MGDFVREKRVILVYCSEFVHPQRRDKFDPRKEIIRAYCCAVLCAVDKSNGGRGPGFYAEYIIVSIVNNLICTLAIVLEFVILLY